MSFKSRELFRRQQLKIKKLKKTCKVARKDITTWHSIIQETESEIPADNVTFQGYSFLYKAEHLDHIKLELTVQWQDAPYLSVSTRQFFLPLVVFFWRRSVMWVWTWPVPTMSWRPWPMLVSFWQQFPWRHQTRVVCRELECGTRGGRSYRSRHLRCYWPRPRLHGQNWDGWHGRS